MIRSFKHRGLRALYRGQTGHRLNPEHVGRLNRILTVLDECQTAHELRILGYRAHQLSGDLRGHYAISVSGNWRVTFRFEDRDIFDVDYIDYH